MPRSPLFTTLFQGGNPNDPVVDSSVIGYKAYTTGTRPAEGSYTSPTVIFDSTLGQLVFTDGSGSTWAPIGGVTKALVWGVEESWATYWARTSAVGGGTMVWNGNADQSPRLITPAGNYPLGNFQIIGEPGDAGTGSTSQVSVNVDSGVTFDDQVAGITDLTMFNIAIFPSTSMAASGTTLRFNLYNTFWQLGLFAADFVGVVEVLGFMAGYNTSIVGSSDNPPNTGAIGLAANASGEVVMTDGASFGGFVFSGDSSAGIAVVADDASYQGITQAGNFYGGVTLDLIVMGAGPTAGAVDVDTGVDSGKEHRQLTGADIDGGVGDIVFSPSMIWSRDVEPRLISQGNTGAVYVVSDPSGDNCVIDALTIPLTNVTFYGQENLLTNWGTATVEFQAGVQLLPGDDGYIALTGYSVVFLANAALTAAGADISIGLYIGALLVGVDFTFPDVDSFTIGLYDNSHLNDSFGIYTQANPLVSFQSPTVAGEIAVEDAGSVVGVTTFGGTVAATVEFIGQPFNPAAVTGSVITAAPSVVANSPVTMQKVDGAVALNTFVAPTTNTAYNVTQYDATTMGPQFANGVALDAATTAGQWIRVRQWGRAIVLLDAFAGGAGQAVQLYHSLLTPGRLTADPSGGAYPATVSRAAALANATISILVK